MSNYITIINYCYSDRYFFTKRRLLAEQNDVYMTAAVKVLKCVEYNDGHR